MPKTILIDLVDTIVRLPFSPKKKLTEYLPGRTSPEIQQTAYSICHQYPGLSIQSFLDQFHRAVDADESLRTAIADVWIHSAAGAEWLPGAPEALAALRQQGYQLVLISNGAPPTQLTIDKLQVAPLFDAIILSYNVGATKPDETIFRAALAAAAAQATESWMVGDKRASDIGGAARLGIPGILVNPALVEPIIHPPHNEPAAEVPSLAQVITLIGRLEQQRQAAQSARAD